MRFRSCGFLLRTLLTPSHTSAAKTSIKPLPRQTVGWGFCDAPGACRANETRVSVPGSAPGKTESSDPRQPPQGCERGARPRWMEAAAPTERGPRPVSTRAAVLVRRDRNGKGNARRTNKSTAFTQRFPTAPSAPGKRCVEDHFGWPVAASGSSTEQIPLYERKRWARSRVRAAGQERQGPSGAALLPLFLGVAASCREARPNLPRSPLSSSEGLGARVATSRQGPAAGIGF